MTGFRFSLRWLFAAVAIAGIYSLALVNANRWWGVGGTVVVLLPAVAAASQVFLHGRQAAFSFGFAATIVLVRGGVFFQGMPLTGNRCKPYHGCAPRRAGHRAWRDVGLLRSGFQPLCRLALGKPCAVSARLGLERPTVLPTVAR
jgi:hypothetical protein